MGHGIWAVADSFDSAAGADVVPHACTAGCLDDGTLRIENILLETPHRIA